jgi:hypothetical protein
MKKTFVAAVAALLLSTSPAQASVLDTATYRTAVAVPTLGTFHDVQTGFVFVNLPQGWAFVGQDPAARSHAVFLDAPTGFVFVHLSTGWKFVGRTELV